MKLLNSRLCRALFTLLLAVPVACQRSAPEVSEPQEETAATAPAKGQESRLANIRQLTSGGENAEAYFSPDGQRLIYQSNADPLSNSSCDQIFTMRVDGSDRTPISKAGRTTCGYFFPDGKSVLYASTHLGSADCPPKPGFERGYVWPIFSSYDIFRAPLDGSALQRLTNTPGYDAEATVGPDGRIVFTSVRDGDMEIYSMNGDGTDVRRLTNRPGPDGGPWFSPDGSQILFRGRPITEERELADYRTLLKDELWRPTTLQVYVMNRDGSNLRQVTHLTGANFAPAWHPDGKRIVFASNSADPKGRDFDVYLMNLDGTGLERVTYNETFDGFPMFSPDGRSLVFASNRNAKKEGDTNVFIADWVD